MAATKLMPVHYKGGGETIKGVQLLLASKNTFSRRERDNRRGARGESRGVGAFRRR